jgi:hypothetical protein
MVSVLASRITEHCHHVLICNYGNLYGLRPDPFFVNLSPYDFLGGPARRVIDGGYSTRLEMIV